MATTVEARPEPAAEPGLKRVLGPGLLLLFIIGDILGAGVYAPARTSRPVGDCSGAR